MSEVKNINLCIQRTLEEDVPPAHGELVEALAVALGRDFFLIAEGRLRLSVPLAVALEHVPPSVLLAARRLIAGYAARVVRAAAVTSPDHFVAWARSARHGDDLPGERIKLLPDGAVLCERRLEVWDDVLRETEESHAPGGVMGRDPFDHLFDEPQEEVAGDLLVPRDPDSLDHPEPLVPRRATPPP